MTKNKKFSDLKYTADGKLRAIVPFKSFKALWFNTGTQCNLKCQNCYIESSPTNDRLVYITKQDVIPFLNEIKENNWPITKIGFTGGEPFINPNIIDILNHCLQEGFEVLVLTNAYKVLKRIENFLIDLKNQYAEKLQLRISLDHYSQDIHEKERGKGTFLPTINTIKWLVDNNFNISIAGRSLVKKENIQTAKEEYQNLFYQYKINFDMNEENSVIFPEMDENIEATEITTDCWKILNVKPQDQMCASERMIVKRKGEIKPRVQACTLLAYQDQFTMGYTLKESMKPTYLNHPFCAQFCVLGGASCSAT